MAKFEATPEQIEAWKARHGDIFQMGVSGYTCYLSKPNQKKLGRIASKMPSSALKNPIKCCEIILRNCWLGGDPEILKNDELFVQAAAMVDDLINFDNIK